ncbi:AAA family ATPase [Ensifer adhaerens]|uniref:AAA family ATPase n=1 Tax=Ensifer adhaerens TaxID=106592 RepID=UPI002100A51C|nr:AAA family ATPase [Ensifer adhaerens]UTV37665.1 AAA family ATPase [Ensifer adhaerens]
MQLTRFTATGIHGFLKFDLKFFKDLTFLTGINGSGKTSAINAIVALISPDLALLANLEFKKLRLDLSNDDENISITAEKLDQKFLLQVSSSDEPFSFILYSPDSELPLHRQAEAESEHYREILASAADHPVVRTLTALPTPMFLGLDRRARFDEEVSKRMRTPMRSRRSPKNVFGASLARSLDEAADLAETRYRDTLIESGKITERLQRELLLSLLSVTTEDTAHLTLPSPDKLKEIADLKKNLDPLAKILGLPQDEVIHRVDPFLDAMTGYAKALPKNKPVNEILGSRSNAEHLENLFRWSSNQKHLQRINVISDIVKKYNQYRSQLMSPVEKYLKLLGTFLNDSAKSVRFNERGYIFVEIDGVNGERPIFSLSSGEAQIFVILTHLSFNPYAQRNVFIIDEPELSLHVQWQELFVDSLIEANPNIQYIMATHSPSIILDKVDSCIDISRKL